MTKTRNIIQDLKSALKIALREGNYSVSVETEQGFLLLLNEALVETKLKTSIDDVNCIINQYMALADLLDLQANGDKKC